MKTLPHTIKYILTISAVAVSFIAMTVFAAPFTPGQTLDPGCNPGDVDCYVVGAGASAAGADTQIQFNNGGVFGASSGLVWDYTNNILNLVKSASGQFLSFDDGTDIFGLYNHDEILENNVTANTGSLGIDTTSGELYIKQDDGDATDWKRTLVSGDFSGYETNLAFSEAKRLEYRNENFQYLDLGDETFVHAFVLANGNLLAATRENAGTGSCTLYRIDPVDMSLLQTESFPDDGQHDNCEKMIYVPQTDKAYIWTATNTYAVGEPTVIIEVNPHDISDNSVFINHSVPGESTGASGSLTSDGSYIYTADGNFEPRIKKFNILTGAFVDDILLDGTGGTTRSGTIHGMETDGTHLYATTFYGKTFGPGYAGLEEGMHKIRISDMSYQGFADMAGHALNPQSVVLGDYIYVGSEAYKSDTAYYPNSGKLFRVKKEDMSVQVIDEDDLGWPDVGFLQVSHYDGRYVYIQLLEEAPNTGLPQVWGRFDTETNTIEYMDQINVDTDVVWPVNWVDGDGKMLFGESYDIATDEYGVASFAASSFVPNVKRVVLDENLNKIEEINYQDGGHTFSRDAAGTVATFETLSTGNNCTIDPSVVGGISCSSDENLKKDITPIMESQFEKISSIQPSLYHWKSQNSSDEKTIGFIAQDVRKVFPELIHENEKTGKLTMSYVGLTVPLVGAVQEIGVKVAGIEALNDFSVGETDSLLEFMNLALRTARETVIGGIVKMREARIDRLEAKRIRTQQLCVDDLCIGRDEFKALLENAGITPITIDAMELQEDDTAESEEEVEEEQDNTPTQEDEDTNQEDQDSNDEPTPLESESDTQQDSDAIDESQDPSDPVLQGDQEPTTSDDLESGTPADDTSLEREDEGEEKQEQEHAPTEEKTDTDEEEPKQIEQAEETPETESEPEPSVTKEESPTTEVSHPETPKE